MTTEGPIRASWVRCSGRDLSALRRGASRVGRCGGKPKPIGSNQLRTICTLSAILYADIYIACRSVCSVQLLRECSCLEVASASAQPLPADEALAVDALLRQLDFHAQELRIIDAELGRVAL